MKRNIGLQTHTHKQTNKQRVNSPIVVLFIVHKKNNSFKECCKAANAFNIKEI